MSERIDDVKQLIDRLIVAESCVDDSHRALTIAISALELIAGDTFGTGAKTGLKAQLIAKEAIDAIDAE